MTFGNDYARRRQLTYHERANRVNLTSLPLAVQKRLRDSIVQQISDAVADAALGVQMALMQILRQWDSYPCDVPGEDFLALESAWWGEMDDIMQEAQTVVDGRQDDTRLSYAARFMRAIVDHCRDGGTFRYLIYDRLGFGPEAYIPLHEAGGLAFSNACPVNMAPEVIPHIAWAGVGQVVEVGIGTVRVTFSDGQTSSYDCWNGHQFQIDEPALCIYLSTASAGLKYALKVGTNYSALKLAEERHGV